MYPSEDVAKTRGGFRDRKVTVSTKSWHEKKKNKKKTTPINFYPERAQTSRSSRPVTRQVFVIGFSLLLVCFPAVEHVGPWVGLGSPPPPPTPFHHLDGHNAHDDSAVYDFNCFTYRNVVTPRHTQWRRIRRRRIFAFGFFIYFIFLSWHETWFCGRRKCRKHLV